jgi:autotransporter-associated beta strand protein
VALLGLSAARADVVWNGTPVFLSGSPEDDVQFTASTLVTLNGPDVTINEGRLFNVSAGAEIMLTVNNSDAVQRTLAFLSTQLDGTNMAGNKMRVSGSAHVRAGVVSGGTYYAELIKDGGTGELILDQPTDTGAGYVLRVANGVLSVIGSGGSLSPLGNISAPLQIDGTGNAVLRFGSVGGLSTTFTNSLRVNESGTIEHTTTGTDVLNGALDVALGRTLTANFTAGGMEVAGLFTGAALVKEGAGQLKFTGVSNVNAVTVNGGRLDFSGTTQFAAMPAINAGGTLVLNSSGAYTLPAGTFTVAGGTLELVPGAFGATNNPISLVGGTLRLAGAGALTYAVTASGNAGIEAGAAAGQQLNSLTLQPGTTLTVGVTGNEFKIPTLASSGVVNLAKTGSGVLELTASLSSSSGTTTISQGTLRVGNGGTTGALPTGAITDNGILEFKHSDTVTLAANITGTGAVTNAGTGTLNLMGTQAYSTLNATSGITNLTNSLTGPSPTINAQGTLNISASQTLSALNIGAGGSVTMQASGGFAELGGGDIGQVQTAVVPEPGSLALLLSAGLLLARRRRR